MKTLKPVLLFYCQHSLGMGHLVRALTLAETFAESFTVVFLNGGRFPGNTIPPNAVEIINLPPLGMAENNQLYSQDSRYSLAEAQAVRKQMILAALETYQPHIIFIELFPFGRKKFAGELMPLLKAVKRNDQFRPLVLCSLRDIMVNARRDQVRHDNRARWLVDRYFDGILMHTDPRFAALEESFQPTRRLKTPIHYTGFVLPRGDIPKKEARQRKVVVSAGGGMVGAQLFQLAIKSQPILWEKLNLPMTVVAGPFLPEADWRELEAAAAVCSGLTLHRSVPSMSPLLASHAVSVSQCGYNTVMDILKSGIPALAVPFYQGQEDEQSNRAKRLSQLGLLRMVDAHELDVARFVSEVEQLLQFKPNPATLDLNGSSRSSDIIRDLLASKSNQFQSKDVKAMGSTCV